MAMHSEPSTSLLHIAPSLEDSRPSKKSRHPCDNPFRLIPSYLLPTIVSYIPIPHLQYRLVNKEWDHAIRLVHSLGQCEECVVRCKYNQLHIRIPKVPWLLLWNAECYSYLLSMSVHLESNLILYLDSLLPVPACGYSITLYVANPSDEAIPRNHAAMLANWCLHHSRPPKYTFFLATNDLQVVTGEEFLSFLRAPGMTHVTELVLGSSVLRPQSDWRNNLMSPFRDSAIAPNLKSLSIEHIPFRSEDAECLMASPYLPNLTHLSFYGLQKLDGMKEAARTIGFDSIICSPIMKNLKSFRIGQLPADLGYCVVEAFAQSEYLKNLTHLVLDDPCADKEWSLEPLLRCDATAPRLTSVELRNWPQVSEAAMSVITSPTSAFFDQIQSLDFRSSTIPIASMKILCSRSDALKSLKSLKLSESGQGLTDEHVQLLSSAPLPLFNNLEYLGLNRSYAITNKSVIALYSSKNLSSLRHIDFDHCYQVTVDVLKVITGLPPRPNLRILSSFYFRMLAEERVKAQEELKAVASRLTWTCGQDI